MPIYEYRCDQGHTFEVMRRMSDEPLSTCVTCEAPVEQVFHPIAIHFKGSGFYNTDYGTKKRSREQQEKSTAEAKSSEGKSSEGKTSETKTSEAKSSEGKTSTSSESKTEPKAQAPKKSSEG